MTRDEEKANQAKASELLVAQWNAWCDAHEASKAAQRAYEQKARTLGIQLCTHCAKPMPEYDTSMQCDGCHLPWGWDTPEGRRKRELAELNAKIGHLTQRRAALQAVNS